MNIRVYLSKVSGSSEADIEHIERAVVKNQPFGLGCERSAIIFIPATFKAYWLWSDATPGPVFQSIGIKEFVDTIKMQYLSHKRLIKGDELLGMALLLKEMHAKNNLIDADPGNGVGPAEK